MAQNLFDNAKFGDMFLTAENKQAVFLRFTENAEYKFAILYIEGWGNVQVFRHNGKEVHNDVAYSIIKKQEEPVSEELEDATSNYCLNVRKGYPRVMDETDRYICNAFKAGYKWKKEQMMVKAVDGDITFDYYGDDKTYGCIAHDSFCLEDFGLKDGDKVKVLVVKED